MDDLESVSDSEIELNRDVFETTTVISIPRRGLKCRRSSVGWFSSSESTNQSAPTTTPLKVIELLKAAPSVRTYVTVKKKLDKSKTKPGWISDFLQKDGLDLLFESFEQLCKSHGDNFLNVILQESCAECVKTIMDSSLSLDYIIENKEFTTKLAAGKLPYFSVSFLTKIFKKLYLFLFMKKQPQNKKKKIIPILKFPHRKKKRKN